MMKPQQNPTIGALNVKAVENNFLDTTRNLSDEICNPVVIYFMVLIQV